MDLPQKIEQSCELQFSDLGKALYDLVDWAVREYIITEEYYRVPTTATGGVDHDEDDITLHLRPRLAHVYTQINLDPSQVYPNLLHL